MYEVLNKDMMKSEILPHSSVANSGHAPKGNLVGVIPIHSLQVESIFTVAHSEEKVKSNSLCFLCSYVNMAYLCQNTKDKRFR